MDKATDEAAGKVVIAYLAMTVGLGVFMMVVGAIMSVGEEYLLAVMAIGFLIVMFSGASKMGNEADQHLDASRDDCDDATEPELDMAYGHVRPNTDDE